MDDRYITLAHGNGGRFMRELIEEVFAGELHSGALDTSLDAVAIPLDPECEIVTSVDGFTVQPLEFPGGDIGSLAVNGTVNDLAVAGAKPRYLTLSAIIEEGMEADQLRRIIKSFATAAMTSGVEVAAGDTKVVPRGSGGGLYLTTTGIGERRKNFQLGFDRIKPGDRLIVSGSIGDHGIAVMLAREAFQLEGDLRSDCASVLPFTQALLDLPGLKFMRDPTRGGLATVCHEIAISTSLHVRLDEDSIPVRNEVQAVCEILGYDPYYLASEGRVLATVGEEQAEQALARWQSLPGGEAASIVGELTTGPAHVSLTTKIGGERVLMELEDDPLPRIC